MAAEQRRLAFEEAACQRKAALSSAAQQRRQALADVAEARSQALAAAAVMRDGATSEREQALQAQFEHVHHKEVSERAAAEEAAKQEVVKAHAGPARHHEEALQAQGSADSETAAAELQTEQAAAEWPALEAAVEAQWAQALAAEHQAAQAKQAAAAPSVAPSLAGPDADEPNSASNTTAVCPGASGAQPMGAGCATSHLCSEHSGPDSGGESQPVGLTQVLIELGSSDSDEEAVAVPVASQEFRDASGTGQEGAADGEQCPASMFSVRLAAGVGLARTSRRWC